MRARHLATVARFAWEFALGLRPALEAGTAKTRFGNVVVDGDRAGPQVAEVGGKCAHGAPLYRRSRLLATQSPAFSWVTYGG
jgi:hypothetical protein